MSDADHQLPAPPAESDLPAMPGLPGSQSFEDDVLSHRAPVQQRALATAYIDLIVRCQQDVADQDKPAHVAAARNTELRALQSLQHLVFGQVRDGRVRHAYERELRDISKSVAARRAKRFQAAGNE